MNRKTSSNLHLVVALVAVLAFASVGSAGTIFVSGDTNIVNPLVGSFGQPVDPGNVQFFKNVLGAGTTVLVLNSSSTGSVDNADGDIDAFYNSLGGGVSSSRMDGTVTSGDLFGVDLFVSPLPDDNFSASEISALSDFLLGGGTVFFTGENNNSDFTAANAAINGALAGLGSGMVIFPDLFDAGFNTADSFQIAVDPFTAGVTSFTYAAPSQVQGGTTLFVGFEDQPFLAYESTRNAVPEPGTLLLLGAGLIALYRRRS